MMSEPRRTGLHACLQGFPGAVVELTPDGVVTDSNGRLEQLLGHDLVGRRFSDILDPSSKHKWGSLLSRDATAVEGSLWELTIESREGLDLRTFAVMRGSEDSGDRLWLLEYARDLRLEPLYEELASANSELVRTQRALAKESARLADALKVQEAAVHLRDDVLAIVAHDLRNPLDRIAASVALLLDETLEAESRPRLLRVMERTAAGMNRLVRDLLDAASIDTGHLSLDRHRVDVTALLQMVCEVHTPEAAAKQLQLACRSDGAYVVHADQGRVMQLLANLLANAIRLTPAGGRIDVCAELVSNDLVKFSVTDTGPGISPHDVPLVFERFWQGSRETRGNAGLGLTIGKGIAEGHGGSIWVESEVKRGTTFAFTIPVEGGSSNGMRDR